MKKKLKYAIVCVIEFFSKNKTFWKKNKVSEQEREFVFVRASAIMSASFSLRAKWFDYNLGNLSHGGGDGKKYKTHMDTFNSRHSPKYHGVGKGTAPYSLGINYSEV